MVSLGGGGTTLWTQPQHLGYSFTPGCSCLRKAFPCTHTTKWIGMELRVVLYALVPCSTHHFKQEWDVLSASLLCSKCRSVCSKYPPEPTTLRTCLVGSKRYKNALAFKANLYHSKKCPPIPAVTSESCEEIENLEQYTVQTYWYAEKNTYKTKCIRKHKMKLKTYAAIGVA